ncbi:TRAP transporter large permease [Natronomonas marina]|jgi:tripartite ATP-independent transporter DctM subunit|uniref:TRAP transporter large permease n=1 Tax=Natronomonas marina TaxID=2961939 RepID=UPI0020C9EFD5|nr:TRAP transporter large permease [Natronomonas marina]
MVVELVLPSVLLVALILLGVPVAFSLSIAGVVGLAMTLGVDRMAGLMLTVPYSNVAFFLLATVPMFILMAEFLNESDLTEVIYEAAHKWFGNIPGGVAITTTLASGGLAALSGSSTATAATMSKIAVPEMRRFGYDDRLSFGTVSAAGTFAVMIPPSLGLIIYGIQTETSISALFIGGIVPGLLTIGSYVAVIYAWGLREPDVIGGGTVKYSWPERFRSLLTIWPALMIVLLVIGGLYLGVVTPTEAGALGAFGTFVVAVVVFGMRFEGTVKALQRTAETTTMIFMIIIGAVFFARYLTVTGVTPAIIDFVTSLPIGPLGILMFVLVIYIALGTMMDQLAILLLTLPITFPLATSLGFDPIWFGILIAKTIEIGLVTPPLGLNVYIATGPMNVDVDVGFRGALRFIVADIIVLALLIFVPELTLFLPNLAG